MSAGRRRAGMAHEAEQDLLADLTPAQREAVSFLVRVKECIESPERLMLEV